MSGMNPGAIGARASTSSLRRNPSTEATAPVAAFSTKYIAIIAVMMAAAPRATASIAAGAGEPFAIAPSEMDSLAGLKISSSEMLRVKLTSRGAEGMTTVWRPRVRIPVPDIDGADADENRRDESTKQGTKRKRAPYTKGPCEHGVKQRSKCKVCRACPHGRRRSQCKECGGSQICEHGRDRSRCKECGGSAFCEHGRQRYRCKECGGSAICEHGRVRYRCKECGGASICEHGRERSNCKECGGSQMCEHGRRRTRCKECGGASICEHGRRRSNCKECGGSGICEHGRHRSDCKECGGKYICEHGRRRRECKKCGAK